MKRVLKSWWLGLAVMTLLVIRPATGQELPHAAPGALPGAAHEPGPEGGHLDMGEGGHGEGDDWMAGHWFVTGEYLLVTPRRTANDFAIVSPNAVPAPMTNTAVGNVESIFWNATSMIRVGAGYQLPGECGWTVKAEYTYLQETNSRSVVAPTGGVVFATAVHPGFGNDRAVNAVANASLHYDIVDLMLGRTFKPAESFSVWLGAGGRFAWINQRFNAYYNGDDFTALDSVSTPIDMSAAGIRVGGEGQWLIGKGLSLYARGYGSLLMGDFHTSETEVLGSAVLSGVGDRYRQVVPVTELGIGLAWKWESFQARIGYEITNWFGIVDTPDFVDDVNQGKITHRLSDLSLDGLALELQFDF